MTLIYLSVILTRDFYSCLCKKIRELQRLKQKLIQKFLTTRNILFKLRSIIVTAVKIDTQGTSDHLSKEDSDVVINYLMNRSFWYSLEYTLYIDCIPFLESEYFEKLYEKLLIIHFTLKHQNVHQNFFTRHCIIPLWCFTTKKTTNELCWLWHNYKGTDFLMITFTSEYKSSSYRNSVKLNSATTQKTKTN